MQGAFSEYVIVDPCQIVHLPDALSMDEGALLEPIGIAFHALELASLKIGESVAVFGAGSIGLLTLAMAKLAGAGETFIFDKLPYRLEIAKNLYRVDHAVNSGAMDPVEYIKKHTNNRGVDISIEAAGAQETFWWTFESARIGGRCYLIGIPEADIIHFDPHTLRRRELLVQNVRRSNFSLERCRHIIQQGKIRIAHLVTHHFPLEKIAEAFDITSQYRDGVLKTIINP
jgi:L-iditol 2-dehydrogenase